MSLDAASASALTLCAVTSIEEVDLSFAFPIPTISNQPSVVLFKAIMRLSPLLLANPTAVGSTKGLKPAPLALLPPIPLYKRLLRTHRKFLPAEMRVLGDEYVKREFRSHRSVENPMHIVRKTPPLEFSQSQATSAKDNFY